MLCLAFFWPLFSPTGFYIFIGNSRYFYAVCLMSIFFFHFSWISPTFSLYFTFILFLFFFLSLKSLPPLSLKNSHLYHFSTWEQESRHSLEVSSSLPNKFSFHILPSSLHLLPFSSPNSPTSFFQILTSWNSSKWFLHVWKLPFAKIVNVCRNLYSISASRLRNNLPNKELIKYIYVWFFFFI